MDQLSSRYLRSTDREHAMEYHAIRKEAERLGPELAAIAFPQVNNFGNLEEVDALADLP